METKNTITVLTYKSSEIDSKNALPVFKKKTEEVKVNTEELAKNLDDFLKKIEPVIATNCRLPQTSAICS